MGRRMRIPKEKARKKVNVKLVERKHAGKTTHVYELLDELVEAHHKHLSDAKIAIAWRFGWKANADGHVTLGQAKKGSDLDRELHGYDFVLLLNHEAVNGSALKDHQLRALIDHELCFPGDVLASGPEPKRGIRRRYAGKLVRLETASGNLLTGTPNHPVLTGRGWVPLGLLNERDCVFSCRDAERVARRVDPNKYQAPATLEQISRAGAVPFRFVPQAAANFDAYHLEGQVDIEFSDGLLLAANDSALFQHVAKLLLRWRNRIEVSLAGLGHLLQGLARVPVPAPCLVGIGGKLLSPDIVELRGPVALRIAPVTSRNAARRQDPSEDVTGDAERFLDLVGACSGEVFRDNIVGLRSFDSDGHVFNLHTKGNWYVANNIVVHNCHCEVSKDSNGEPKKDEQGRTVWRIRKHDVEEFREVVARHGCWKDDLEQFVAAAMAQNDRPLLRTHDPDGETPPLGVPASGNGKRSSGKRVAAAGG